MVSLRHFVAALLASLAVVPEAGPVREQADAIDRLVKTQMAADNIPGVSLQIIRGGHTVKEQAYGLASLEHQTPASMATVYELASLTKPILATAVMMLVEEDRIGLDDPVSKHLGEVPQSWSAMTVRHLLTHTSGLPDFYYAPAKLSSVAAVRYTVAEQLADARALKLRFKPGEKVAYSTAGFFLLSQIVKQASGMPAADFIRERVFGPAGMRESRPLQADLVIANRADGYTKRGGVLVPWRLANVLQSADEDFTAMSTAGDLARYDAALRGGRLLKPETMTLVNTPARLADGTIAQLAGGGSAQGSGAQVGLGWFLHDMDGRRYAAHAGHTGCAMVRFLDGDGLTVIVMTNLSAGFAPPYGRDSGYAATAFATAIAKAAMAP